jgi:hypothetical protein
LTATPRKFFRKERERRKKNGCSLKDLDKRGSTYTIPRAKIGSDAMNRYDRLRRTTIRGLPNIIEQLRIIYAREAFLRLHHAEK